MNRLVMRMLLLIMRLVYWQYMENKGVEQRYALAAYEKLNADVLAWLERHHES